MVVLRLFYVGIKNEKWNGSPATFSALYLVPFTLSTAMWA